MHGFLWKLHRDHHIRGKTTKGFFQKNDLFFLIFATPAIILILAGFLTGASWMLASGAGITLYGFTYFAIHDLVIHKRIPVNIHFSNSYMTALVKAHQAHHNSKTPADFMSYGLLIFPAKYFK
jgi:beta-carotene 3-hydroxylase